MDLGIANGAKPEVDMIQLKFIVGILTIVVVALVGVDIYYDSNCKKINALSYDCPASALMGQIEGIA